MRTVQLLANLFQGIEALCTALQGSLARRWQGVAQHRSELSGLDPVADVRVSQSVQEMDEVGIPGFVAQPEQSLRNPSAVFSGGRGDLLAQLSFEPFYRVALAILLDSQIGADADVFGQEEPGAGLLGRARGLEPSAEGAEAVDAVLVGETQLKPHIAHMVTGFAPIAHEPTDGGPVAARSVDRAGVTVQQEREQHLERLGLAGTVLPAK